MNDPTAPVVEPAAADPSVSVVIPTFDRPPRMLREAICSVLEQEGADIELIIVDDGSADGGAAAAQVVDEFDAPITLRKRPHGGIAAARNAGIEVATGELLAFLDSDDIWSPSKLRFQIAALGADEVDAVYGRAEQFYDDEVDDDFKGRYPINDPVIDAFTSPALLLTRATFDRVGPFDPECDGGVCIDWHLRARELGIRWVVLPEVVFRRRIHATNHGIVARDAGHSGRLQAIKRSLDRRRSAETA